MKILTLNTWQKIGPWKERWEVIFRGLEAIRPDIAAFQEVFDPQWRAEAARRSAIPYMADPDPSGSGLVLLSRFPIKRSELYTMKTQSPFEDYQRYLLWAEVTLEARTLHFFNTHLSWKLEDQETRKAQVREARDWIDAKKAGGEMFLMGDLNATPDSAEIRWFLKSSGLVDTYGRLHPNDPGFSWDNRNRFASGHKTRLPDRRIDYILVGGKDLSQRLASCELIFTAPDEKGVFASDHFGFAAEFFDEPGSARG